MIVVRFKIQCKPENALRVMAALKEVIGPSRRVDGVISFDVGRDIFDQNSFIATEVFTDRAALERQEALPEVANALGILEESMVGEPEATIFHVSSSEPWGD